MLGRYILLLTFAAGINGPAVARVAAPDFETQVLPVLTRAGCNTGACHGAAIGRGGLRLSLLGYDPQLDAESLLHELRGRRINLARPEKSLLLTKPTRQLPHEGGHRLGKDTEAYNLLLDWIKAGAPLEARRTLQALEMTPSAQTLSDVNRKFQVQVTARFADGSREDVTRWAVFTPADPAALRCSPTGEVTVLRRGQSVLMVRFLGEVGCVTALVPVNEAKPTANAPARHNFIDEHINRTLDQLHLPASPRAADEVLVRRVYLDLIGTLPTPEEVAAYRADRAADKFAQLVERLLARPEFVDHWAYQWGDLLRITSNRLQTQGVAAFHGWIREQVKDNTPLDRMAKEMVLALGDGHRVGPVNFSRIAGDPRSHAEHLSQVWLGVRLQCANCHNHPLDRWTQDDYHGLAAIFAKLSRGQSIQLQERGEVIHPKSGQNALPRLPGERFLNADGDQRQALADWLTGAKNPFFARTAVNRLWRALLGRGLVEPVDDHRSTNPATHPELLDALAKDFAEHGFDVRHTLRVITASAAYQRSSLSLPGNRTDDRFYAKALVRALPPVVMVDAVSRVTGVAEKFSGLPDATTAIALTDSRVPSVALDLLGRCDRNQGCGAENSGAGSLPLTLHKINGSWLNDKLADPRGRLHQLLHEKQSDEVIVAQFYRLALSRQPSATELAHWKGKLSARDETERKKLLEDFCWALLNATEFCCNH
ncbi:MAG: DUF1549 domain-containing protein [Planctomycetia bacterium]|nr:DUF1549 domain-containing protein [Planctomycetia bacterium]